MEAVDYRGTAVAFIQLVTAMSKDRELRRVIRGKRTYRIEIADGAVVGPGKPSGREPTAVADAGAYSTVARKLVEALARQVRTRIAVSAVPCAAELAALRAERDRLRVEYEAFAVVVEHARSDLSALLDGPISTEDWAPELDGAARALLVSFRREADGGEQVS